MIGKLPQYHHIGGIEKQLQQICCQKRQCKKDDFTEQGAVTHIHLMSFRHNKIFLYGQLKKTLKTNEKNRNKDI